jgi:3-hydroxybutyryl-CoA dehydrogenase
MNANYRPETSELPVVGICGHGQMGASAAVLFARAGYRVLLWGRDEMRLKGVTPKLELIASFLSQNCNLSRINSDHENPEGQEAYLQRIAFVNSIAAVGEQSDYILECIAERLTSKVDFFQSLKPYLRNDSIVMSCTSGLSIRAMGSESGIASQLVGAHFWNPPHLMPLVEVIDCEATTQGLAMRVEQLLASIGKITVRCKDIPGFIGNRLLHALWREATYMVDQGYCTAEELDKVVRLTFALRMPVVGPCENIDLVGLPLVADIQSYLLESLANHSSIAPAIEKRIAAGHEGMRTGHGFYDWTTKSASETIAARDQQIVSQLRYLQEQGLLS